MPMPRHLLVLAAFVVSLSGCPGPTFVVQQYAGAVRPRESIATLRVNGNDVVRLATLDGEDLGGTPIASDSRLHIELLPGKHTFTVLDAKAPHTVYEPVTFQAEAGKVYRVTFVLGAPRIYEVDRGADTTGADVTQP